MNKGCLFLYEEKIFRVVAFKEKKLLVIDCLSVTMPKWMEASVVSECPSVTEEEFRERSGLRLKAEDDLTSGELCQMHQRFSVIAGIIPNLNDDYRRNQAITLAGTENGLSRRTVTNYLCKYLAADRKTVLVDYREERTNELTQDQKNMRWALNKFYYTRHRNKLTDVYVMMLKAKYTDKDGHLIEKYPSMRQLRYFFNKTRKKQTEIISREGIKEYQLNHRPLTGDSVRDFAPCVGYGMLDATVCDLYLVDEAGKLVGRPILVAGVDAYSGMCMGYSLLWEGGVYSCRELLANMIEDKVEWCRKFGVCIKEEQWPCNQLPGTFITDRGSEYISYNFEQISELGCRLISLPSFSANLKGPVEKLFDLVQNSFKPYLKGKGVIEPDFQKRGARDYRRDACLTIEDFEKIIIHCIVYHNTKRLLENFPYTEEMLEQKIKPYPVNLWKYSKELHEDNLIRVSRQQLQLTLLPRTEGAFTRYGLKVNGLRYHCEGYTEQYLTGGSVTVSFNPDDVSQVYLPGDAYQRFWLIENRFQKMTLDEVRVLQKKQKEFVGSFRNESLKAKVELANHIEAISGRKSAGDNTDVNGIQKRRQRARAERHQNQMEGAER